MHLCTNAYNLSIAKHHLEYRICFMVENRDFLPWSVIKPTFGKYYFIHALITEPSLICYCVTIWIRVCTIYIISISLFNYAKMKRVNLHSSSKRMKSKKNNSSKNSEAFASEFLLCTTYIVTFVASSNDQLHHILLPA